MVVENRRMEDIDSLKEKLLAVSSEIDAIKNSFSKSAEELSRVQRMLNVGNLEDLGGMIGKFESRIAEVEQQKREAADGAKRYSEELEKEKERLIKLWDAYKNQEEELSVAEKKATEYEDIVRASEVNKKQLEDDLTARINTLTQKLHEYEGKAGRFDEYKQKYESFESTAKHLETELNDLRRQNSSKENIINDLNTQIMRLKEKESFAEYKEKYDSIASEYEKEKERLTKLYQLYEETDSECKKLKEENQNWQSWYNSNKDVFEKLFSTAPPIGETSSFEPPERPENPIDRPIKTKKKSIFRRE